MILLHIFLSFKGKSIKKRKENAQKKNPEGMRIKLKLIIILLYIMTTKISMMLRHVSAIMQSCDKIIKTVKTMQNFMSIYIIYY